MAKRNVTISLDEDLARWARVEAARRDLSVSQMVADLLRERSEEATAYEEALGTYLAGEPRPLGNGGPYPARNRIHDRADLRR